MTPCSARCPYRSGRDARGGHSYGGPSSLLLLASLLVGPAAPAVALPSSPPAATAPPPAARPASVPSAEITSPEEFFGFALGSDRKLARWDRIVEYFRLLERESDRILVRDLGPTTDGNPFLLAVISSPDNLARLDRLAEISRALADPRGLSEAEVEALVGEGRAFVAQSLGLHSTEVGGAQAAPLIAYDLLAHNDEVTRTILDESVLLLLPCINPDGQIMVTDWYRRTVGTEYEGSSLPWLYHRYAGHDNNRDGDYLNLVESRYLARVLYREYKPQAYIDHHQMGSYGARMYVPPYSEPIRPGADPLLWREIAWYGAHIATKLQEAGVAGVLNAAQYPGWGHFGWHWITPFHNIAGMLTESASALLATPLYIHPDQLRGGARGLPRYEAQSNMPEPWPGGWWRLGDIVRQQVIAARALQEMAARHRVTVLRNAYLKARRQIERGGAGSVRAYVVPAAQHDAATARRMIDTLLASDVEVWRAREPFRAGDVIYDAGSFVVPMAQPKSGLVLNLLGRTLYPDNEWTRARDGRPLRPYDLSTHTMAEQMGVRVDALESAPRGSFAAVRGPVSRPGTVAAEAYPMRLDGRANVAFHAVNLLLDAGATLRRAAADDGDLHRGDFLVIDPGEADAASVAAASGADLLPAPAVPADSVPVRRGRVAIYRRYRGGNIDEGWTRLLLERFGFPYESLRDAEIRQGHLIERYDVIVLPHDAPDVLLGTREGGFGGRAVPPPPEYRSGLGEEGVAALREFVHAGGRLVALGEAGRFAVEQFDLDLRDAVAGLDTREFFCPGSTLRARVDTSDPLAWGMDERALVLFWDNPAFEIAPSPHNDRYRRVVVYGKREILQSGWLVGERHLANRAAVVAARVGEGEIVLLAARVQHRAQTDGTFKLLFNALLR